MTLSDSVERLANLVDSAQIVVLRLQALRDATTDDQWERYCSDLAMDALLDACLELEHEIER